MDGKIAKQYGVKTFPTAVIEVAGKRIDRHKSIGAFEDKLR